MEKPILFNTEMVRAILEGRKTSTRRIIKPQPPKEMPSNVDFCVMPRPWVDKDIYYFQTLATLKQKEIIWQRRYLPYRKDDILWVQETWKVDSINDGINNMAIDFKAIQEGYNAAEKLCDFKPDRYKKFRKFYQKNGWQSPYFMPREAARIFLKVTDVKVQKLQDITEDEAKVEGIPNDYPMNPVYCPKCKGEGLIGTLHPVSLGYMEIDCPNCGDIRVRFKNLWNSIYTKQGYGWDANPWVWVIEFVKE